MTIVGCALRDYIAALIRRGLSTRFEPRLASGILLGLVCAIGGVSLCSPEVIIFSYSF